MINVYQAAGVLDAQQLPCPSARHSNVAGMIVRNCCIIYVLCATAPNQGVSVSVSTYATCLFLNFSVCISL